MASFPHVHARNLEGAAIAVPNELGGDVNCIVVAFHREHQRLVNTWLPHLDAIAVSIPGFCYFEMPTISRRWAPARWFIDGGMTQAIPDRAARERTITVYTNVGPVVAALGLRDTSTIATVLVDRRGSIVWQCTGAYTADAGAALEQAVAASLAS